MEDNNTFIVDTIPSARDDLDVPQYAVSRKSIELIKIEETTAQRTRSPQTNLNPCWNCGKPKHSVRDCRAQTNHISVEWNKELQMLLKENQKFRMGSTRYHENENTNKYAHIVPGTISPRLRKIMGLKESDIPPFIYQLRKHGYPKAWLRHASIKPSGLNLYDAHGNEVADPDAEEGEILEEEDKIRYDLSKLITYPGFNAPLPEKIIDDYVQMDAPPYNELDSLELMINDLQEKAVTEYRLKKERLNSQISPNQNGDSDVVAEEQESNSDEEGCSSHLPCNLESVLSSSYVHGQEPGYGTQASLTEASQSKDLCTTTSNSISEECLGRVLSVSQGTPILKSKSGHSRLPPAENFSKDICDVINFENLPESTGKFEKMRNLLKKVKRVLGLQRKDST